MTQAVATQPDVVTLSPEDEAALDQTTADLTDLTPEVIQAAERRQRRAYDIARRVLDGSLDPLSA